MKDDSKNSKSKNFRDNSRKTNKPTVVFDDDSSSSSNNNNSNSSSGNSFSNNNNKSNNRKSGGKNRFESRDNPTVYEPKKQRQAAQLSSALTHIIMTQPTQEPTSRNDKIPYNTRNNKNNNNNHRMADDSSSSTTSSSSDSRPHSSSSLTKNSESRATINAWHADRLKRAKFRFQVLFVL